MRWRFTWFLLVSLVITFGLPIGVPASGLGIDQIAYVASTFTWVERTNDSLVDEVDVGFTLDVAEEQDLAARLLLIPASSTLTEAINDTVPVSPTVITIDLGELQVGRHEISAVVPGSEIYQTYDTGDYDIYLELLTFLSDFSVLRQFVPDPVFQLSLDYTRYIQPPVVISTVSSSFLDSSLNSVAVDCGCISLVSLSFNYTATTDLSRSYFAVSAWLKHGPNIDNLRKEVSTLFIDFFEMTNGETRNQTSYFSITGFSEDPSLFGYRIQVQGDGPSIRRGYDSRQLSPSSFSSTLPSASLVQTSVVSNDNGLVEWIDYSIEGNNVDSYRIGRNDLISTADVDYDSVDLVPENNTEFHLPTFMVDTSEELVLISEMEYEIAGLTFEDDFYLAITLDQELTYAPFPVDVTIESSGIDTDADGLYNYMDVEIQADLQYLPQRMGSLIDIAVYVTALIVGDRWGDPIVSEVVTFDSLGMTVDGFVIEGAMITETLNSSFINQGLEDGDIVIETEISLLFTGVGQLISAYDEMTVGRYSDFDPSGDTVLPTSALTTTVTTEDLPEPTAPVDAPFPFLVVAVIPVVLIRRYQSVRP